MIFHFYYYRLKILLKNRSLILWTCLLPLMIATMYYIIFYNVSEDKSMINIPIAVQKTEEGISVGDYLSSIKNSEGISLYSVSYVTDADGVILLQEDKVHAYITYDGDLIINSGQNKNKNILKTYLDIYLERKVIREEFYLKNNTNSELSQENVKQDNILKYVNVIDVKTNGSKLIYFYALIGLACMLGSSWGFKEMMDFYGEESVVGLKIQISTLEKKRLILTNNVAILTVHFISLSLLLLYMDVVLNVINYRNTSILYLIIFVGSFVGINFGAALYTLLHTNKRVKKAVLNIVILVGSIISGLFYPQINYVIMKEIPMIHYLNPASLITNTFYNLIYKGDYLKVYVNLSVLLSWGILFEFIALTSLRRRNYANI